VIEKEVKNGKDSTNMEGSVYSVIGVSKQTLPKERIAQSGHSRMDHYIAPKSPSGEKY
jgi:hypothetical protein